MIPKDKFGKQIYDNIYSQLLNIGMKLSQCGYTESDKKPNLFYKSIDMGIMFADMRGTEQVPIWEDPVPLVYFNFDMGVPNWKQTRIRKEELNKLENNHCPYRFSFYEDDDNFFELLYSLSDKEEEIFGDDHFISFHYFYDEEFPNGSCKGCGKDIENDSYHCSKECREIEYRKILAKTVNKSPHCKVCKKKIIPYLDSKKIEQKLGVALPDKLIGHHIRYVPEKKIDVCTSCHNKIHHSKDEKLKPFLPVDSKPKLWKWWARLEKELKKVKCKKCGHIFAENKQKCPKCKLDKTHARTCENCGYVFNGYGRTTCPKCRTFFR